MFLVSIIPMFFSKCQSPPLPVTSSDAAISALVISEILLINDRPLSLLAILQP